MILTHACSGLPELLLGQRIVAHPALDPAARLALFRSCHALARMVLLHPPSSSKRITHHVSSNSGWEWSSTLATLLSAKGQPLPPHLDLELRVESSVERVGESAQHPLPPPPSSITHHVSRLHLHQLTLTAADLAAWQLHDPTRWPHLQHLTLHDCKVQRSGAAPPLPPIPGLQSTSFPHCGMDPASGIAPLLPLAANATQVTLGRLSAAPVALSLVVGGLPRLTRLRTDEVVHGAAPVQAMLQHPTLEHVEVGGLQPYGVDLSQQPCRWRTLTLRGGVNLHDLPVLPLAGLERLTVVGIIAAWDGAREAEGSDRGLAALQRLHEGGRLALAPGVSFESLRPWALRPGEGMFDLGSAKRLASPLLRLVVEAGRGVNVLGLEWEAAPVPWVRGAIAPLLEQHAGKINTLCFHVFGQTPESWCAGVLGALPACITHVKVLVFGDDLGVQMRALVRGGAASLRHPLKLTVLPGCVPDWWLSAELAAELAQLAAGGSGGAGQGQRGSLLMLEVAQAG